ncbi:MAG: DUF2829 domain-containing protein [Ignisphaera sp.]|nr:DUF2829 domain-containing protein [Ignisphaera sp.]
MYTVTHIGLKNVKVTPMTRGAYNEYRGWTLPSNERYDDEGYLIEYEPRPDEKSNVEGHEGYVSWTPKRVFDDAYHDVSENLPFGLALELVKQGYSIARKGWNGKGLKVSLQVPNELSKMTLPYLYMQYPSTPASDGAPRSHINARVPWLASQTDMLSSDWFIVKDDKEA